MDDSVIKVLRRNGSWSKSKSNLDKGNPEIIEKRKADEEFSLDKNFGILAEEIKKRMNSKYKNYVKVKSKLELQNDIQNNAKKKLLPFLKNIETLTNHRDNYLNKIDHIDQELEIVKNEIIKIKKSYEKNINDLQDNIDFFDQSIFLIEKIKGEG